MALDDEGLEDDAPVSPLLPPDDRLWLHPSELGQRLVGRPQRELRLFTVTALTSTISVLLTLGLVAALGPVRTQVVEVGREPQPSERGAVDDVAGLAARVLPAIARVTAERPDGTSTASGVVYRRDGVVLTSASTIVGATATRVLFHDGTELPATILGADAETDIAALDVAGENHAVATFGSKAKVGDRAITIGSPTGPAGTPVVSVGVVSALGQLVKGADIDLLDMMQTDAPVAAGCSGGAVVDRDGEVIGIAAGLPGPSSAVGYATPIGVARAVATQLVATGKVARGWLGVEAEDGMTGPVVKRVTAESPAAAAGLVPGDVILGVDERSVPTTSALVVMVRSRRPGDVVTVSVLRDGKRGSVQASLVERPAEG